MYIPMFVTFAVKEGKNNVFKNAVMPVLATVAALFMMFVAVYAHGIRPYREAAQRGEFAFPVLFYLIVFTVIMAIGTSPNPLIKSTTEGLEVNSRGGIIVTEDALTSRDSVYAGGDAVTGAATVISAMGAGKTAASAIDKQLSSK
jgi:hypothetical protein